MIIGDSRLIANISIPVYMIGNYFTGTSIVIYVFINVQVVFVFPSPRRHNMNYTNSIKAK